MNEKEKSVIYTLMKRPEYLEKVTIPDIFTGQPGEIIKELHRQFSISQSFDYEIACDELDMKRSELEFSYEAPYI